MPNFQSNGEQVLKAEFNIAISPNEYLKYYQGKTQSVLATSTQGLRIRFPANLLAPYVTLNGIKGKFVLEYLATGKLVGLTRIND